MFMGSFKQAYKHRRWRLAQTDMVLAKPFNPAQGKKEINLGSQEFL